MLKHEAKLIDPGADAIVSALTETTAAANKRCRSRLLEDAPPKWKKFARAVADAPEGYEMFRGGRGGVPATQVLAAWWTDAIGRKHVVVRGRRVEHDEAKRLLQKDELDTRTPLWHAYPEYVCRRTTDGAEQIVCACGCGAVGTPEALGWMGETCGPCFDRKEELGAAGLSANLPGVLYGDREPLRTVSCSPDGARVVAVEGSAGVTLWDIPNRTRDVIKFGRNLAFDAAITAEGRHLLVAGPSPPFAVFDLTTDPPTRFESVQEHASFAFRVVPLSDPALALTQQWWAQELNRLVLVRVPSGETVRSADLAHYSYLSRAAYSVGEQVLVCGPSAQVIDTGLARPARELSLGYPLLAFSPDGTRVFGAYTHAIHSHDALTGKRLARTTIPPQVITALAVDPVGGCVYAGTSEGQVVAFATDSLVLRAALDWHLGAITGLAVSADGARLFSSGSDGCVKVWPIRDLLRGA